MSEKRPEPTAIMYPPPAPSPIRVLDDGPPSVHHQHLADRVRKLEGRVSELEEEVNEQDERIEKTASGLAQLTKNIEYLTNAMTAQLLPLDAYAKEISRLAVAFEGVRATVESQATVLKSFQQTQDAHASNHLLLVELFKRRAP